MKIRMGLMVLASAFFVDGADAQLREEMLMENAGFIMRPANTPEAMAQLKIVPPRKMVARTKAGGQRYYIYADPDGCKCAMIGNEAALRAYRDMPRGVPQPDVVGPGGLNRGEFLIHEMAEDDFRHAFPGGLLDYSF